MIYLDSSALVKLALAEPESDALTRFLGERSEMAVVSSTLLRTEVPRAIWRTEPGALPQAQRLIRRVSVVAMSRDILDVAATARPAAIGTAAAIHLASALAVKRDLAAFVSYDKALLDAAREAGLPAVSPV